MKKQNKAFKISPLKSGKFLPFLTLTGAILLHQSISYANETSYNTGTITVEASKAQEMAKYNSQMVSIITSKDIEEKQAKSVEDIIFTETGVSRTVDSMGRVGVSIRGAEPRHTLILVDGQQVLGDLAKFSGAADEVMRLGTENVDHIEIVQGSASAKYGSDAIGGVINIITKKAQKEPAIQFNAEASRLKGNSGIAPYTNYFLRADSGSLGNLRLGIYGSKRDILPVYATNERRKSGMSFDYKDRNFKPNALRFHGTATDVGVVGTYDLDDKNKIDIRLDRYTEDLNREIKHSDSDLEPQQIFKRDSKRDSYNIGYNGTNKDTDYNVELNYSRIRENDIALINYFGESEYEGKNELRYIDNVDHAQTDFKANFTTQINDKHLLSYGIGIARETGKGSRLKSSPKISTMYIDPYDYDKNLKVEKIDRLTRAKGDNTYRIYSHVHDYNFVTDNGRPLYINGSSLWDMNNEYYGSKIDVEKTKAASKEAKRGVLVYEEGTVPTIDYGDYIRYGLRQDDISEYFNDSGKNGDKMSTEKYNAYKEFKAKLKAENKDFYGSNIVGKYFEYGSSLDPELNKKAPTFNGKKFLDEYKARNQRITYGEGSINKQNLFISDDWQLDDDTIFTPTLRLDRSSLFGTNISGNLGITHNLKSDPHRRLKFNLGTGYAEPGMGELWYNWEMFASNPVGIGVAKMGWYWQGNPDLKPEKSLNIDLSLEGENNKTYGRLGIFHNRIKDYMTVYYTGNLMDFAPFLPPSAKYQWAPDLIYSFKNIGKAHITGIQGEVKHKFDDHFSGKLGYTYLHAINKSDKDMPRFLLDKPRHKIDIGINYKNDKSKLNVSLWADYYIKMLDSNSLKGNANYYPDILEFNQINKKTDYKEKTFGTWNLMVQKGIGKDSLVYFGINNIFNHHDDDRAMQSRVFRFGLNLKFTTAKTKVLNENGELVEVKSFLDEPFIYIKPAFSKMDKKYSLDTSYLLMFDSHGGTNRNQSYYRADSAMGDAKENMVDKSSHLTSQSIAIDGKYKLDDNTNLEGKITLDGYKNSKEKDGTKGTISLKNLHLEKLALNHKFDDEYVMNIGRIGEEFGATGYYFSDYFDGLRITKQGDKSKLSIGYGDFKNSTGIENSPYTHATYEEFYRPPTAPELIGLNYQDYPYEFNKSHGANPNGDMAKEGEPPLKGSPDEIYESQYKGKNDNVYFYQQLQDSYKAGEPVEKQLEILARMHDIVKQAYGKEMEDRTLQLDYSPSSKVIYKIKNKEDGTILLKETGISTGLSTDPEMLEIKNNLSVSLDNVEALKDFNKYLQDNQEKIISNFTRLGELSAKEAWDLHGESDSLGNILVADGTGNLDNSTVYRDIPTYRSTYWDPKQNKSVKNPHYLDYRKNKAGKYEFAGVVGILHKGEYIEEKAGSEYTPEDINKLFLDGNLQDKNKYRYGQFLPTLANQYWEELQRVLKKGESENLLPRTNLGKVIGKPIKTAGYILKKDVVPPINKAIYLKYDRQLNDKLGLSLWHLHSADNKKFIFNTANGKTNEEHTFKNGANVFGIGAKYDLGNNTFFTVDYGINRSRLGKFLNGSTLYDHTRGTTEFTYLGRKEGGAPSFFVTRIDIGKASMDKPKSWNAFLDYKYFRHGSFFGGNGTNYVPDRYLDGVRSYTIGLSYVPEKDFMIEGFYTFNAKGIGKRDTFFGAENFKLGNYARVKASFRF